MKSTLTLTLAVMLQYSLAAPLFLAAQIYRLSGLKQVTNKGCFGQHQA